jgi:hypothetical protein
MCDRAVETPIPAPEREEVDSICFAGETNAVGWGSRPARPLRDIGPTRFAPTWLGLADLPLSGPFQGEVLPAVSDKNFLGFHAPGPALAAELDG